MAQTALLENGERPDQRDRNLFDALRVRHDFVAELAKRAPLDMLPRPRRRGPQNGHDR